MVTQRAMASRETRMDILLSPFDRDPNPNPAAAFAFPLLLALQRRRL
jgi:hypothetical protein